MSLATLIADVVGLRKQRAPSDVVREDSFPDVSAAPPDSRRLIRNRRYCHVLASQSEMRFDDVSIACAWKALEHEMTLVPGGDVSIHSDTVVATSSGFDVFANEEQLITVDSLYIDRNCVTNADYARFVQSDGYSDPENWPVELLPHVLHFNDRTGHPGPRDWENGNPSPEKENHPVVGICWYEANAYAKWVGKRLPSTGEWQRAGTWPQAYSGNESELRYPWGNAFDPCKANTWASGRGGTAAVSEFSSGNTPNGVRQLIGNVWEWVDNQFSLYAESDVAVLLDGTIAEIRGGAFDSYFHSQTTCQFRTGQSVLFRGANVGFRCCISSSVLSVPFDASLTNAHQTDL